MKNLSDFHSKIKNNQFLEKFKSTCNFSEHFMGT